MKTTSFFIPGLAMNSSEVDLSVGAVALQNPGFTQDAASRFNSKYTVEDVAEFHLSTILQNLDEKRPLRIMGMSFGGMIVSLLATEFRDKLPKQTEFVYFVTSSNSEKLPLLSMETLSSWKKVRPGSLEDFASILRPFFSTQFLESRNDEFLAYVEYRCRSKNQQTANAYNLQLGALLNFRGDKYFRKIVPDESLFIYGQYDAVVNQEQQDHLRLLAPQARHVVIPQISSARIL
jgi:pimeloyl-ACP methyl ester carboxylesterase